MTSNKTNDNKSLTVTVMACLRAVGQRMCVKKIRCSLRDLPVIGPYRARSDLRLSRRF